MDLPANATSVIVDVELVPLLGADASAFLVEPSQLVFSQADYEDAQNVTVSFGALPACCACCAVCL